MAVRGRKPLPTALKELEGDRGKGRRPLNKDEPTPPQDNVKCPAWEGMEASGSLPDRHGRSHRSRYGSLRRVLPGLRPLAGG